MTLTANEWEIAAACADSYPPEKGKSWFFNKHVDKVTKVGKKSTIEEFHQFGSPSVHVLLERYGKESLDNCTQLVGIVCIMMAEFRKINLDYIKVLDDNPKEAAKIFRKIANGMLC